MTMCLGGTGAAGGLRNRRGFDGTAAERLLEPLSITGDRLDVPDAVHRSADERPDDGVVDGREPIVHPQAVSSGRHESRPSKIREMSRGFRLRNPERVMDVAHAHFARREERQDPQPGGISEGAQRRIDGGESRVRLVRIYSS